MAARDFYAARIVQQARDAFDHLPFSLEEWLDQRDDDFSDFEDLDQPARHDAFFAMGRLQGAAEACGLTMRAFVDLVSAGTSAGGASS
jgi:hypothetical protein